MFDFSGKKMGGVEGKTVGNYDGYLWGRNDIVAGKSVGNNNGYGSLKEALDVAKAAKGAEVITEKEGKYFLNEVRGTHYSTESEKEVTVRAYPSVEFSKVVAFTDDYDNVIAQFDKDENLEMLGKIDQIKNKISTLPANTNPDAALKIAGAMLGVGSPEFYSTSKKLVESLKMMPKYLPDSLKQKFEAMLKPESVAAIATVLTVYAASHAFGVGEVADVVLVGAGLAFLGADAIKVAKNFYDFASTASNAKNNDDLERAATHLAEGISTALFDGATTLIGAKAASGAGKFGSGIANTGGGMSLAYAGAGSGRIISSTAAATGGKVSIATGGVIAAPSILQMSSKNSVGSTKPTDTTKTFYDEISKLKPNERVPVVRKKAQEFAESKGWERAKDIERKNGNRTIYKDDKGNLYSVDTQHGHFEVCNPRGKHQGSIDLWGNEVPGKYDSSGKHDLFTK